MIDFYTTATKKFLNIKLDSSAGCVFQLEKKKVAAVSRIGFMEFDLNRRTTEKQALPFLNGIYYCFDTQVIPSQCTPESEIYWSVYFTLN